MKKDMPWDDDEQDETVAHPAVSRMYNIFHPHDPVAYRIEPILDKRYKSLRPAPIEYTKGGLTGTIVGISDMSNNIVEKTTNIMSGLVNSTVSWFKTPTKAPLEVVHPDKDIELRDVSPERPSVPEHPKDVGSSQPTTESFHPPFRLDFALQEGIMENPYLSALGVHMNYWSDQDTASFIIKELYGLSSADAGSG